VITVASTVAGVFVGYVVSWSFARSSKRTAELRQTNSDRQLAIVKDVLLGIQGELSKTGPGTEVNEGVGGKEHASTVPGSPYGATEPNSVLDLSVRVMLGTLLDEHGQVELNRLLLGMSRIASPPSVLNILSSLARLRTQGVVSWDGGDVGQAKMIRMLPRRNA